MWEVGLKADVRVLGRKIIFGLKGSSDKQR